MKSISRKFREIDFTKLRENVTNMLQLCGKIISKKDFSWNQFHENFGEIDFQRKNNYYNAYGVYF